MPAKSQEKLRELLSQRDRTADICSLADEALIAFQGTEKLMSHMKLLFDDERTPVPVKARILELVCDFIKEASKKRQDTDPTGSMPTDELLRVIEGFGLDVS